MILLATMIATFNLFFIIFMVPESLPEKARRASWGSPITWEQADPFMVRRGGRGRRREEEERGGGEGREGRRRGEGRRGEDWRRRGPDSLCCKICPCTHGWRWLGACLPAAPLSLSLSHPMVVCLSSHLQSLRKATTDVRLLHLSIMVLLSYLPEAGQYSCFFLYLRQVMP